MTNFESYSSQMH